MDFALPFVCAHCGSRPGTHLWPIRSSYNRFFLVVLAGRETLDFYVPVCDECKSKLERRLKAWRITLMVCGLSTLAFLFLIGLYPPWGLAWFALFALALLSSLVAIWQRMVHLNGSNLGRYDGKRFRFKNVEFQRQFAALNPGSTFQETP